MFSRRICRLIAICAVVAVMSSGLALAEESIEEPSASEQDSPQLWFDLDLTYNGKYVWRGISVVDGDVFQPCGTIGYGGLWFNGLGSMYVGNVNTQAGRESLVDLTLDYTWSWDPVDFSVGAIYYTFPHSGQAPSTIEIYAGAALDAPLSPSLTVYQDVHMADGAYVSLAGGHTFEDIWKPADGISVSAALDGSVSYGTSNFNDFYYGSDSSGLTDALLTLSFPVSLGEHFSLSPALNYSTLLDSSIRDSMSEDDNFWAGVTLSYSY